MAIIPPQKFLYPRVLQGRVPCKSTDYLIRPPSRLQRLASCIQSATMAQSMRLEQAYPEIRFRWRSRNWLARLMRMPAECEHLEHDGAWMATFIPDTLYLR